MDLRSSRNYSADNMINPQVQKILKQSDEYRMQLHKQLLKGELRPELYRKLLRKERRETDAKLADVHDLVLK